MMLLINHILNMAVKNKNIGNCLAENSPKKALTQGFKEKSETNSPTKRLSLTLPNKSPLSDNNDVENERRCSFAKKINEHEIKKNFVAKDIFTLVEKDEDSDENFNTQRGKRKNSVVVEDHESMHSSESDSLFDSNMTKISVKLEKNQRDNNKFVFYSYENEIRRATFGERNITSKMLVDFSREECSKIR